MLEQKGHTAIAARPPGEAMDLAHTHSGVVNLLMTDMNGRDLAEKIYNHHPNFKCLFMSGDTATVIAHHGSLDKGINFIQKPFSMGDLSVKLREVLDEKRPYKNNQEIS